MANDRVGELLVREKLISLKQLQTAQEEARKTNTTLAYQLSKLGYINDKDIVNFLSRQYNIPAVDLDKYPIDEEARRLIPRELSERHKAIALKLEKKPGRPKATLIVAMADPMNINAISDIEFKTGYHVEAVIASEAQILRLLSEGEKAKSQDTGPLQSAESIDAIMRDLDPGEIDVAAPEEEVDINDLARASEDAPIVRLCNAILLNAIQKRASDIHIEPYEKELRVRYRIDGMLVEVMKPPVKFKNAIASRIKIMASLDIAERRLPQDGRIKLKLGKGREMDFRVNTIPTLWGEKIVLRLLDKSNLQLDMTKLGFDPKPLADFRWAISQPYGMVLVTGPTGSGKTTTLYSALSELNRPEVNIATAEDPIEYNLLGINQCQINEEIGFNFAAALRAFLRQDPDIIMVGEIRDFETAEIAIKAALTGHLVLSTLHTNDAPSTVTRLLNMGIEPFLVTASLNLVLAQRLARRICERCKQEVRVDPRVLVEAGFDPKEAQSVRLMKGAGCEECNGTGYKGRVALYEVMPFTDRLKEMVIQGCTAAELKQEMIRQGVATLRMAGLSKVKAGITTLEEVLRVTAADRVG
ncbi:MAG: type IV-A pilus assembly ATPase PilB [Sandaracinaceae bacterium]|nr:type IV-A pilus assembly ATPase PilB [Sandaracinaceae bacterium]